MKEFNESTVALAVFFIVLLLSKLLDLYDKRTEKKKQAKQRVQDEARREKERIEDEARRERERKEDLTRLENERKEAIDLLDKYRREELARVEREKRENERKSRAEFTDKIDRDVRHIETRFLAPFRPLRVFVIHFSNGESTEAGLHLPKITVRHEIRESQSVLPLTDNYYMRPSPEYLSSVITRVRVAGSYHLKNRELLGQKDSGDYNPELFKWLNHYGVKSMYCTELRKNYKFVAILVLQFAAYDTLNSDDIVTINEEKKAIERIYEEEL